VSEFYTNAQVYGKNLLVRGVDDDGVHFKSRVPYEPTLYTLTNEDSPLKTLEGRNVKPKTFRTIMDAKEFVKTYDEVANMPIYGMSGTWQYPYLNETYRGCDYDFKKIKIFNIDIEVECADGFPEAHLADEIVNAITVGYNGMFYSWGLEPFHSDRDDVKYMLCKDEKTLLSRFINFWAHVEPDIVTGWHIDFFDIPYLVRRITKILDEDEAKKLSPWRMIREKMVTIFGNKEQLTYEVIGLSILDYHQVYRKFTFTTPENFKLNTIAELELKEKKLDYSEVGSLHLLYQTNYQKFMEYNIRDVELIWLLEDKLRLLEMVIALAYDACVNYNDTFTQVRMWDVLAHNELMSRNIVVPPKKHQMSASFAGGYVKTVIAGAYKWIVSFDLDSMYH